MAAGAEKSIAEALAEASVSFAYLFGSRARASHRETSDADVAVMPTHELELRERAHLAEGLSRALDAPEVDLILLDRASLELRGRVVQQGRLIYSADEPARVAFEVRTRSEYLDYLPTLREHTQRYLRQVAERGLVR